MLGKALKIVFWGEDSFSDIVLNSLLEAGYHVCAVITPFYDNLIYKRINRIRCFFLDVRMLMGLRSVNM